MSADSDLGSARIPRELSRLHDAISHAILIAWRQLRHNLGFSVLAVSILALGMTATVTAFSVVTHVLWHPLPVADPERVVGISVHYPDTTQRLDLAPGDFVELRDRLRSLEHLAAVEPFNLDLHGGAHPEVVRAGRVTAGFFEAFGVHAAHGRVLGPDDYRPGQHAVAVLTWRFWREHFDSDPRAVGAIVRLAGEPHTIVGVLPDLRDRYPRRERAARAVHASGSRPRSSRSIRRALSDSSWTRQWRSGGSR